jgi:hypothetical protein
MIVAIVAVVMAMAGTSVAAFNLSKLTDGAKDKTVGVGKLTYVTSTISIPKTPPGGDGTNVAVACPTNLHAIGGGIKLQSDKDMAVNDSHPTTSGWAGTVFSGAVTNQTATITAACAKSRVVTGAPPTS